MIDDERRFCKTAWKEDCGQLNGQFDCFAAVIRIEPNRLDSLDPRFNVDFEEQLVHLRRRTAGNDRCLHFDEVGLVAKLPLFGSAKLFLGWCGAGSC